MNITRRRFLQFGAAGAAGLILPEWMAAEPKRTIFLPPKGGWVTGQAQLVKVPTVDVYVSGFGTHNLHVTRSGCRTEKDLLKAIHACYMADHPCDDVVVTPECWREIYGGRRT
jgi:hypothetical protein